MRKFLKTKLNKVTPYINRAIRFTVRSMFELIKLTGLAFTVMHLVVALYMVEVAITAIVVFAAVYFTKVMR